MFLCKFFAIVQFMNNFALIIILQNRSTQYLYLTIVHCDLVGLTTFV